MDPAISVAPGGRGGGWEGERHLGLCWRVEREPRAATF